MSLTQAQKQTISEIDAEVKSILENHGTEENILVSLLPKMPTLMELIKASHTKEMEMYFDEYEGFFYSIKILENLAQNIANGTIKVPR